MFLVKIFIVIFFITNFCDNTYCFQISSLYYFLKQIAWCDFFECCNEKDIPGRFDVLQRSLEEKVYGQHLAQEVIYNALVAHYNDKNPYKALTLSLHGWPGSGKNYITKFIKEAMYKKGSSSKFIHHFTARIHFPSKENIVKYQADLQNWIKGNVSNCERSLFIFDEVDKMPENVLNAIKPMIDYNDLVDNVDYRKSVFIFMSNTGGKIINEHFLNLWEKGKKRKDVVLADFEKLIAKGAFNEEGGFHNSDTIKSSLIDHYIPFLPMEREHVKLCIKDIFNSKGIYDVTEEHINEVMESVEWGPKELEKFSSTGCKRLSQKVPLVISKYKLKSKNDEL